MLAIGALLCFVLALFGVQIGALDLVVLGLALLAAHLIVPVVPWRRGG